MIDAKFGNLIPCIWIETHLRKKEKKRIINSIFDWKIMYKYALGVPTFIKILKILNMNPHIAMDDIDEFTDLK